MVRFSIQQGHCEIHPDRILAVTSGSTSFLLQAFFDRRLAQTVPLLWLQGLVGVAGSGALFAFGFYFSHSVGLAPEAFHLAGTVVGLMSTYFLGSYLAGGKGRTVEILRARIRAATLHTGAPPIVPPFVMIEYANEQGRDRIYRMGLCADRQRFNEAVSALRAEGLLAPPKASAPEDEDEDDDTL